MGRVRAATLRASALGAGAVLVLSGCGISDGTDIAAVLADEEFIEGEVDCGNASVDVTSVFTCSFEDLPIAEPMAGSLLDVEYIDEGEIRVEGVSIDPADPGDALYRRLQPGLVQLTEAPFRAAEPVRPGQDGTLFVPGTRVLVEGVWGPTAVSAQSMGTETDDDRAVAYFPAEGEELLLVQLFVQDWAAPEDEDPEEPGVLWAEGDGERTEVLTLDGAQIEGKSLLLSVPEDAPAHLVLEFDGHEQHLDARTGQRQVPADDPAAGWYSLDPVHPRQSIIWAPGLLEGEQDLDGVQERLTLDLTITEAGLQGWAPEHAWLTLDMRLGMYPQGTFLAPREFEAAAVDVDLILTIDGEEHSVPLELEADNPRRGALTADVVGEVPPAGEEILLRLDGEAEVFQISRDEVIGTVQLLSEEEVLLTARD
ncbi:hypothetical protein GCM10010467_10310 [Actinocorallia glomerata]|uniref:DUF2771 domain-containing protein n=3 Tax=Actinomycetota TaxID=201174 RepID=A0ABP6LVI6_9MICC